MHFRHALRNLRFGESSRIRRNLTNSSRLSKSLAICCLALILVLPVSFAEKKPRRYKIRDLKEAKIDMKQKKEPWWRKVESALLVVGTLGLFYWIPNSKARLSYRSDNVKVDIQK